MIRGLFKQLQAVKMLGRKGFWVWAKNLVHYSEVEIGHWTRLQWPEDAEIHPSVSFRWSGNIELGERTRIRNNCVLWASRNSKIRIGALTGIGPGVMIFASNHRYVPGIPYIDQPWDEKGVDIGSDVWIGAGSVIVAGAVIGDGTVVAAGSVVTSVLPANVLAAGVPAKVIKSRNPDGAEESLEGGQQTKPGE